MANRKNTFLIKRSNVAGKVPAAGDLQLGELALNTADNILYASGTTANSILPIGWDRVARTGDTMTGGLFAPSISATTISATTYFNLPTDVFVTGGTYTSGNAIFTNNTGGTFTVSGFAVGGGGGQVFYLNLSQSQNGNRLLSTTASTASEQTSGVTIANGVTSTIASFQSQPLNITLLPGGIWSFYLHSYKQDNNASFNIFVEVYKRTSGGTETLLFATDPAPVTTNSPNPSMQLSDGYFSGTSLNVSDSVVAVVRATNTDNQSHTITLITEGSTHYSYVVSTIPTQQGLTCDTLSGCSIIQTIQTDISNKFDKSGGTVNGATNFTNGLSATTVSATTYYNLPTDVRVTGATYSSNTFTYRNNTGGTFNVLFNTMTGLTVNGNVVITGTTNIGSSNDGLTKLYVETNTLNTAIKGYGTSVGVLGSTTGIGYGVVGQGNGGYGVYGTTTSNTGGTSGVYGWSVGDTYTNIGVYGLASDDEVDTATNIGGFFYAAGQGLYNYSVKLNDGSEGLNKVLISKTADGKANWSSILSGLTGVYTNTLSATTYFNLPTDIKVTGGTYSNGSILFTNNTGGTFTVSGFFKTSDDVYTTGMTFNASTYDLSITRNDGTSYNQSLAILASDMTITGGTYSSSTGLATFTNNTGGTFNVSGFLTGMTDTYTTGFTYSDNTFTITNNTGGTLTTTVNTMTGLTVNGTVTATNLVGDGTGITNIPIPYGLINAISSGNFLI